MRADGARRGQVSAAQTIFCMSFGRTDLMIGVPGAKFDAEVDFEVRFAPPPPKLDKNLEKRMILVDFSLFHIFRTFSNIFVKFSKFSEGVRMHPNASERTQVHPNASKQVQTGPSESKNFKKLVKTSQILRKFANQVIAFVELRH